MRFLDSSIWLAHLVDASEVASALLESEEIIYCSILTLFEVKKKLITSRMNQEEVATAVRFIRQRAIIININEEIIDVAVDIAVAEGLSAIDSLLYASALSVNTIFVTADNDFRGLPQVQVIEK